jgi:diguanylate cyclase
MTGPSTPPLGNASRTPRSTRDARLRFARRSFFARTGGLGAAYIMFVGVMLEKDSNIWLWMLPTLFCLAWPSIAWQIAQHAKDPRDAERRNLLADHFVIGIAMAIMQFNLLPSVLAVALPGMNTLAGGGWNLLARGLPCQLAGVVVGGLVFGWHLSPSSSSAVIVFSMPLLLFQPMAVGYVAFHAIRALNEKRAELERLSQIDGLSGLSNRMHWEQQVRAEFARFGRGGEPAALVYCDLDHFKRINDTYGHAAGDEAIRRLAESFRRVLRQTDASGRIGGEEFGILLPSTSAVSAREVVERLQADLQFHPLLDAGADQAPATASFGIVELDHDIASVEMWMRLADDMLYQAKHEGRNRLAQRPPSGFSPLAAQAP